MPATPKPMLFRREGANARRGSGAVVLGLLQHCSRLLSVPRILAGPCCEIYDPIVVRVGAKSEDIKLGEAASVTTVKNEPLDLAYNWQHGRRLRLVPVERMGEVATSQHHLPPARGSRAARSLPMIMTLWLTRRWRCTSCFRTDTTMRSGACIARLHSTRIRASRAAIWESHTASGENPTAHSRP